MSTQINYLTILVLGSLKFNKYIEEFRKGQSVDDVKRIYKQVYFKNRKMDEKDIKGARIINFEAIYQFVKEV